MKKEFVPTPGLHIIHKTKNPGEWLVVTHDILKNSIRLCRCHIEPDYLKGALLKGDTIIYTMSEGNKQNQRVITGFTVLSWHDDHVETLVICADPRKGSAKPLMLETFRLARHRKYPYAKLEAIDTTLKYYPKFSYKPLNEPLGYKMYKNLSKPEENLIGFSDKIIVTNRSRKRKLPAKYEQKNSDSNVVVAPVKRRRGMEGSPFPEDSIVWVSGFGYPWPAQVVVPPRAQYKNAPRGKDDDVFVVFFGTGEYTWTKSSRLCHYLECYDQYARSKVRDKKLRRAIEHANASIRLM